MPRGRLFFSGVALVSGASIGLSLLFTRIFSVTLYYHFAFLVISLALLGIAVSGVLIAVLPRWFGETRLVAIGAAAAVALAPAVVVALAVAVRSPLSVDLRRENFVRLGWIYLATALPFFCSGLAISAAITAGRDRIGRVYACDLGGAAAGCLLVIPLLPRLGGPGAVLAFGALGAAGGVCLALSAPAPGRPALRAIAALGALGAVAVLLVGLGPARQGTRFRIAQTSKFLRESEVVFERWNALSRVTVSRSRAPDYLWLHIDADAATRMFSAEVAAGGYEAPRRFSEVKVAALVYALRAEGPALVIGPGGGPDVVSALRAGVPRVVGVEVNPIIVDDVMRGRYAAYNGDLYRNPRVQVVVDDGRSFARRSRERYSSIQATLVDTWAASAAGAFTLTENNLYTVEAFEEYLGHLLPRGVLSMTRWFNQPPREFLRLVALARAALERQGVPPGEIARHVFVGADLRMATLLVSRSGFAPEEIVRLREECARAALRVLYDPGAPAGRRGDPTLAGFLEAPDPAGFLRRLPFDASPTTDDRPFFFYSLLPSEFPRLLGSLATLERNNLGLALLQLLLLASVGLTLVLVVLPLVLFRRRELRQAGPGRLRILAYFLALGLGYILVELGLMQRFVLFLGHPLYALALVLATLLGASGAGSALSPRLGERLGEPRAARAVVGALTLLLAAYALGLGPLFRLLLPLPLFGRALVAGLLVALLGLGMGMLLPLGVRVAGRRGGALVAWAWGLNGATSVVGSVLAVAVSMQFGFRTTLLAGLGAYLLGAAALGGRWLGADLDHRYPPG